MSGEKDLVLAGGDWEEVPAGESVATKSHADAVSAAFERAARRRIERMRDELLHAPPIGDTSVEFTNKISTGMVDVDRTLGGGLEPGQLTVVAGPHGSGKTAFLRRIRDRRTVVCFDDYDIASGDFDNLKKLCASGAAVVCAIVALDSELVRQAWSVLLILSDVPKRTMVCWKNRGGGSTPPTYFSMANGVFTPFTPRNSSG